jgi:hypothetical protein
MSVFWRPMALIESDLFSTIGFPMWSNSGQSNAYNEQ